MTNTSALPGMGTMTDDTSTLGTSDLTTDPGTASYGGDGSTGTTGGRRGDERSQAPGTLELMRRGRVRIYGRG
jgi:hypothetical protein